MGKLLWVEVDKLQVAVGNLEWRDQLRGVQYQNQDLTSALS